MGASGCGKTTLLRILAGLLHPTRGVVRVGDQNVTGMPANGRAIVFQGDRLFPWRTALQNTTVVTPAALLAGVDRMVSSLSLANGYANATFRAPSRYDGASATRMMRWDEAASRWHYVSAPALVP